MTSTRGTTNSPTNSPTTEGGKISYAHGLAEST
jgi:hypothetical protein